MIAFQEQMQDYRQMVRALAEGEAIEKDDLERAESLLRRMGQRLVRTSNDPEAKDEIIARAGQLLHYVQLYCETHGRQHLHEHFMSLREKFFEGICIGKQYAPRLICFLDDEEEKPRKPPMVADPPKETIDTVMIDLVQNCRKQIDNYEKLYFEFGLVVSKEDINPEGQRRVKAAAVELSKKGLAVARHCSQNAANLSVKSMDQALDALASAKYERDFTNDACPELAFALRQVSGMIFVQEALHQMKFNPFKTKSLRRKGDAKRPMIATAMQTRSKRCGFHLYNNMWSMYNCSQSTPVKHVANTPIKDKKEKVPPKPRNPRVKRVVPK